MYHQPKNGFGSIFVGIPQHQKGHVLQVPRTSKIISSYDFVFDESFSGTLSYTSQPYAAAVDMRLAVSYTRYPTSLGNKLTI